RPSYSNDSGTSLNSSSTKRGSLYSVDTCSSTSLVASTSSEYPVNSNKNKYSLRLSLAILPSLPLPLELLDSATPPPWGVLSTYSSPLRASMRISLWFAQRTAAKYSKDLGGNLILIRKIFFSIRSNILGMDDSGSSKGKMSDAKWTRETEAHFVALMLEEVVNVNCVDGRFSTSQWTSLLTKLNERCSTDPPYEMNQIMGKQAPLKSHLRHFHTMLTKATETCTHYDALTTIFFGSTATGISATVSTQPPQGRPQVRRSPVAIPENELFSDEGGEDTYSPDNSRSTRRYRTSSQSIDTVMNSFLGVSS
ncbi:FBD-associated F-box protein, partial [Striga asiatica]